MPNLKLARSLLLSVASLAGCASPLSGQAGTGSVAPPDRAKAPRDAAGFDQVPIDSAGDAGLERREPRFASKRLTPIEDARLEPDQAPESVAARLASLPPIVIDFETFPHRTSLDGVTVAGVTFERAGSALMVVEAAATRTPPVGWSATIAHPESHRLRASSGDRLLSPGGIDLAPGPDPERELDSLTLHFDPPVCHVAIDLASQSADGMSFVRVEIIDTGGNILHAGEIPIRDRSTPDCDRQQRFAAAGLDTWSFATSTTVIAELRLIDSDNDASCPDSNFGVDSIRFAPTPRWLAADLNDDGIVNEADVARVVAAVQQAEPLPAARPTWIREDLNCDRHIDLDDVVIVLAAFGTAPSPR